MTIEVAGLRGAFARDRVLAAVADVRAAHAVDLQAFDPAAIYGEAHARLAAEHALAAHARGDAPAKDVAASIACFAAGTPKIAKALERVGLPEKGDALIVVAAGAAAARAINVLAEALDLARDDDVIQENEGTLDRLGIPEVSRAVVGRERWPLLVQERVALTLVP